MIELWSEYLYTKREGTQEPALEKYISIEFIILPNEACAVFDGGAYLSPSTNTVQPAEFLQLAYGLQIRSSRKVLMNANIYSAK